MGKSSFAGFTSPKPDKTGININGVIKDYIIQAGSSITAGDFVEFIRTYSLETATNPIGNVASQMIDAIQLSDTKALLVNWRNADGYICATVLDISGTTVTQYTTTIVVNAKASSDTPRLVRLSDTTAVITNTLQSDNSYNKYLYIVSLSGTTLSIAQTFFVSSGSSYNTVGLFAIEATKIILFYTYGSQLYGTVFTISGTTITARGTDVVIYAGYGSNVSCRVLSDGRVAISFNYSNYVAFAFLTISGTTISVSSASLSPNIGTSNCFTWFVSDSRAILLYLNGNITPIGIWYFDISISGSTVTFGSLKYLSDFSAYYFFSIVTISDTKALLTFANGTNPFYPMVATINLVGSNVILETKYQTYNLNIWGASVRPIVMNNKKVINFFNDGSYYLVTRVANILEYAKKSTSIERINGIAKSSGESGNNIKVITQTGGL